MLFVDSCYIIALMNKKARNHKNALKLLPVIEKESTLINSTVLLEILNNLNKKRYESKRHQIIRLLFNMDNIYYLNETDYTEALEICKYYNFSVNYSDCTIIKTMEHFQVNNIVSFDGDFDKVKGINRIYL